MKQFNLKRLNLVLFKPINEARKVLQYINDEYQTYYTLITDAQDYDGGNDLLLVEVRNGYVVRFIKSNNNSNNVLITC